MKSKTIVKNRIIDIDYEKNKISWLYYMPLLLIAGFVPLIVYGKYVDLTGTTQALYWTGQNQLLDFFSYWKSRWVIFLTAVALITYIFLYITKKLPFKKVYKYYIPLGIYAFFVILSTIFAIDVQTALNGFVDMYQGMWVLLSYVAITFLVINFVNSERDVKLFLYAFIFLIIVEGLIGVVQYFGYDIFNTKFGNNLIIPSGVQVDNGLTFNFGKYTIYGTLFNTNYVGSFATLMLPMAAVILISARTNKRRIVASIALALCLFTWIGCNSRAGYVGVAFLVLLALIMFRRYLIKYWKVILSILLIGIVGLIGLNFTSNGKVISQISRINILDELKSLKDIEHDDNIFRLEDIKLETNSASIIDNKNNILKVVLDNDKFYFHDGYDNQLPIKVEDDRIFIDDERYSNYIISVPSGYSGVSVHIKNYRRMVTVKFYFSTDGVKILSGIRLTEPIVADKFKLLEGLEPFASDRGYIWGRTIPLFKNYLIIGSGSDNYIYSFPQNDFIAKLNFGWSADIIVDKPHNMFLQIGINTGVMSLIALVVFWLIYIFDSIKLYWKISFESVDKIVGLACLLSVIGYLIAGVFNDYIVSVSPLFWIILGLGISINIRVKKKGETDV